MIMGKGSSQRPGKDYQDNWEKIFGNKNKEKPEEKKKDEKQFCK